MSRFQRDLEGANASFWQAEAWKELEQVKADLEAGRITVDSQGVARNRVGRALMDDLMERLAMVCPTASVEATRRARDAEVEKELEAYRKAPHRPDTAELRAAFGEGATVVDIITGETFRV